MTKKMAIRRLDEPILPIEAFIETKEKFIFAELGDPNLCYVMPYVIVTDGKDILLRENDDNTLDLGWRFTVDKAKGKFCELTETTVLDGFWSMWKRLRVGTKPPEAIEYSGDHIKKPGVEYRDLDMTDVSVHSTGRGVFSVTKKKYSPVYFLIVPNGAPINFIPHDEKPCVPTSLSWLAQVSSRLPLSYASQKIMEMIRSGEIIMPIISEPTEWPQETD